MGCKEIPVSHSVSLCCNDMVYITIVFINLFFFD